MLTRVKLRSTLTYNDVTGNHALVCIVETKLRGHLKMNGPHT